MNSENKRFRREGYIYLLDMNSEQVDFRKYKSPRNRTDIVENWKKLYRLEEKKYFIVICPF